MSSYKLVKHKGRHKLTMNKSLLCDYCGKHIRDKMQMLRHMFTQHQFLEEKHECQICNKKYDC